LYYRIIASAPGVMERAAHTQEWLFPVKMEGGHEGPITDSGWEVWPKSLYDMLMRITRDYNRPVLEITESGCAYNEAPDANGVVHDPRRITYHQEYLAAMAQAMQEGADVRGYHAWSLLDNFEWAEGFSQRFGFTYVDYKTQKRTIKESGKWYAKVAIENRVQANS
jgi:beta-glucosidase